MLLLLTVLAFGIRIWGQPNIPHGFHRDEAGIAYSAYSVLNTGFDEWGRFMPLHFKALGDYPPGIYNYLVAVSIIFFDLTEIAERMPAIILGSLLVPLSFTFVKTYFRDHRLALLTAFLVVISPWDIVQSRAGSEALTALFFALVAALSFSQFADTKKWLWLGSTVFFFFLGMFSYNSAKLGLPLWWGILIWYWWPKLKVHQRWSSLFATFALMGLAILMVFSSAGRSLNFNNTSVFTNQDISFFEVAFIREGTAGVPATVSRIFSNKLVNIGLDLTQNYAQYFSFNFLASDGGYHKRYVIPKVGPILWLVLPFIVAGMTFFADKFKPKRIYWFLLFWLVLAPVPAAITTADAPNVKRALLLFLPLLIFAAHGFLQLYKLLPSSTIRLLFLSFTTLLLIWNVGFFAKQYFIHSAYETVIHRSWGYDQVFEFTQQNASNYDQIHIYEGLDSPVTQFLFHTKYPPQKYQAIPTDQKRNLFLPNKEMVRIEQYFFNPSQCPVRSELKPNFLFAFPEACLHEDDIANKFKILQTINLPDGRPWWVIGEYQPIQLDQIKL